MITLHLLDISDSDLAKIGAWLNHEKMHHSSREVQKSIAQILIIIDEWATLRDHIETGEFIQKG